MRKNIQVKKYSQMVGGELPATNVKGINKEAEALRNKFRSPFGFCGPMKARS
jgi:hypothetical protein